MYRNIKAGRYVFICFFVLMISFPLNESLAASESELVMARQRDAQFLDPNVATSDRSVNGLLFGSIVRRNLYHGRYSRNRGDPRHP